MFIYKKIQTICDKKRHFFIPYNIDIQIITEINLILNILKSKMDGYDTLKNLIYINNYTYTFILEGSLCYYL